jgi:predicted nucleotidyltransferase
MLVVLRLRNSYVARSSLDFADRAALQPLARLLSAVRKAIGDIPLVLVGAAARDVLLVHAHGVEPQRATEDTDVALAVRDWDTFLRAREALVASGAFKADGPAHRLWFGDQRVDIIPFGGVEGRDRNIAWPPEGDEVMNVSGFAEALATAISVRLPGGVSVDVASLPAMAVLKIWAWQDRKYTAPGKDAADLWEFLRYYADAGNQDRLYGPEGEAALASYGFDVERAGAWLLGTDAREVLAHGPDPKAALAALDVILRPETDPDGSLQLVAQMPGSNTDRQISLLTAFRAGLLGEAVGQAPD